MLRWVAHTPADSLFGIAVADTVDSRFTKWALRFAQSHSIQQQALPCGPHLSRSRSERVSQCTCERNSAPRHGCSDAQAPLVLESTRFGPCGAESSAIGVYGYGLPQVITVRPFDELLKYPMAMERALTNPARAAVSAHSNATRASCCTAHTPSRCNSAPSTHGAIGRSRRIRTVQRSIHCWAVGPV